jgi:hypothetical protein
MVSLDVVEAVSEGKVQNISGLNNEAPSRPDGAGANESEVLGQGQAFCGTS